MTKSNPKTVIMFALLYAVAFVPTLTVANVPETYTADNFFAATHDSPKSFWSDGAGGFAGVTRSGKQFSQQPVIADMHVGLHRFSIQEATFYISNLGLIYADSDTVALSIYLARAGWEEVV